MILDVMVSPILNDFEVTYESPFPDPYVIELIKNCGTLTITEAPTPTPPPTPPPTPTPS